MALPGAGAPASVAPRRMASVSASIVPTKVHAREPARPNQSRRGGAIGGGAAGRGGAAIIGVKMMAWFM